MLDFARGRLGGGFTLNRDPDRSLRPLLEQVADELRTVWPDRQIETTFAVDHAVDCDPPRIAQLLSNLTGNALKHGKGMVKIRASTGDGIFELAVDNEGEPIPADVVERLFNRFSASQANPGTKASASGFISPRKSHAPTAARCRSSPALKRHASRCEFHSVPAPPM